MRSFLVLGGPGAGKTRRLLDIVEEELAAGIPPSRIAFVAFTKEAANVAIARASDKFGFSREAFVHFRTIHSMCHRYLAIDRNSVMQPSDYDEIGELLEIEFGRGDDDSVMLDGDRQRFIIEYARSTCQTIENVWEDQGEGTSLEDVVLLAETIESYKLERGMVDYPDMLDMFVEASGLIDVDVAAIDETQDLTPRQWNVVDLAFRRAERIYYAGDDDQAIYEWMGADVDRFLSLGSDAERTEVLPVSYRLPETVFRFAEELIGRVSNRYAKPWSPRANGVGTVKVIWDITDVDLTTGGTWLLLARNVCFLSIFHDECRRQGVIWSGRQDRLSVSQNDVAAILAYEKMRRGEKVRGGRAKLVVGRIGRHRVRRAGDFEADKFYSLEDVGGDRGIWHEAFESMSYDLRMYYLNILRRGARLQDKPLVRINTIHGVKGAEADNVVLMDTITRAVEEHVWRDVDAETRVFYVGATRARERLFVLATQEHRIFPLT